MPCWLMRDFNKQVNAAIVDPNFIAEVREKLELDQRQAAEIFGGGVNARLGKHGAVRQRVLACATV